MRLVACLVAAVAVAMAAAPADAAERYVLPLIGAETSGPLPVRIPKAEPWPAGARSLGASCLTHLPDGTVLVCVERRLLALGEDGRMRRWAGPFSAPSFFTAGILLDAQATPDGGVLVLDDAAVWRVASDAARTRIASFEDHGMFGAAIAASPDGGAVVADDGRVVAFARDGTRRMLRRRIPDFGAGPSRTDAVTPLADGSYAVAAGRHVVRVAPDGGLTVLAGGEQPFVDGAPAAGTDVGAVAALAGAPGGQLVVAATQGLFTIGPDGRLSRIGTASSGPRPRPFDLTLDGLPAEIAPLGRAVELDPLSDGVLLAILPGPELGSHVAAIATLDAAPRPAVVLPPSNRRALRDGAADIIATTTATGRIDIYRDRSLVTTLPVAVSPGTNRVATPLPPGTRTLTARIEVQDQAGRVAVHHLRFVPSRRFGRPLLQRMTGAVEFRRAGGASAYLVRGCRRRSPATFRCRWLNVGEGVIFARGRATFTLRDDGLVAYAARTDRGRSLATEYLEPL